MSNKRLDLALLSLAVLGAAVTGTLVLLFVNIINQSEEHVRKVRKTNVAYTEALQFRAGNSECERYIERYVENNPTATNGSFGRMDLTPRAMVSIGKMKNLRVLDMTESTVDDESLAQIEKLQLEELFMFGTNFSDPGMKHVEKIRTLKRLDVGATRITDAGLKAICVLRQLEELGICADTITDRGLAPLVDLKELTRLNLSDDILLSRDGMKVVAAMPNLDHVDLGGIKLTPEAILELRASKSIRSISFLRGECHDKKLKAIGQLKGLIHLKLSRNPFTDAGLTHLYQMKNLKDLIIEDCPNISSQAVENLKRQLPNCQVSYSRDRMPPNILR